MRSFAQTTSSHTVISHIALCKEVPEAIQSAVLRLQQDERFLPESAVYGSRKIFYDRIWSRLHGIEDGEGEAVSAEGGVSVKGKEKPVVEETGPVEEAAGPVEESESNKNKRKDPPPEDAEPTSQPEDKKSRTEEESVVQEV